ncbi:heat-inducible transcriptional repressor HrcA [Catenovulum sediminis]|uniref:Heat-inducible transcription repressor HrcA n=1 Tax=Catenovulum sediminis TaxID=1740262 RepID=A0ABV1RLM9_9ALTE|nr:heat-inducible transcriptional repressor HrcA [Catenovulum sediminis]
MANKQLNDKALKVLNHLVEYYLNEGHPVSSKCIAQQKDVSASAATVRNIMMTLEREGLLKSPHTSAGRIPTVSGLRLFVDKLMTVKNFHQHIELPQFEQLRVKAPASELCQKASMLLADLTQFAGFVTVPEKRKVTVDKLEFIQLTAQKLLAVIVMHDGDVQNRVIELPQAIEQGQLQKITSLMNMVFCGNSFIEGCRKLKALAESDKALLCISEAAFDEKTMRSDVLQDKLMIAGQNHLLSENISQELNKIRALFDAISNKKLILDMLKSCQRSDGVKIFIGEETGIELFSDCALVSAPYHLDGKVVGSLAVIGSTRMDYRKVIPIVDMTSRLLTSALNHSK